MQCFLIVPIAFHTLNENVLVSYCNMSNLKVNADNLFIVFCDTIFRCCTMTKQMFCDMPDVANVLFCIVCTV